MADGLGERCDDAVSSVRTGRQVIRSLRGECTRPPTTSSSNSLRSELESKGPNKTKSTLTTSSRCHANRGRSMPRSTSRSPVAVGFVHVGGTAAANGGRLSCHRMEAAGQLARIWCRFAPSPLRVRRVVRTCRPPPSPDTRQPPHRRRRPLGNSSFPWLRKAPPGRHHFGHRSRCKRGRGRQGAVSPERRSPKALRCIP
jgi:hypothetical protein